MSPTLDHCVQPATTASSQQLAACAATSRTARLAEERYRTPQRHDAIALRDLP